MSMKIIIGFLFLVFAFISAGYISIWWGIVEPITTICQLIDAHQVTATAVCGELIKFVVRDILAVIDFAFFGLIGMAFIKSS